MKQVERFPFSDQRVVMSFSGIENAMGVRFLKVCLAGWMSREVEIVFGSSFVTMFMNFFLEHFVLRARRKVH